jgi:ParB/RepB/Spo0J family partition protein
VESPTKPRKTFGDEALRELAQSILMQGLLQPILVRPLVNNYEVVCGARRFRACALAGLSEIECRVVDMSDEQVIDAQIVENLQRQDVHPLEEAACIEGLLKTKLYDSPQAVADKIGRSERFVRRRLKLMDLRDELVKALQSGEISLGWAELASTLTMGEQAKVLARFREPWGEKTVESLRRFIHSSHRSLVSAPWKLTDAKLLPQAGACSVCPHNSDNGLFPEKDKAMCANRECFEKKLLLHGEVCVQKAIKANPGVKVIYHRSQTATGVLRDGVDVVAHPGSTPRPEFPKLGIAGPDLSYWGVNPGALITYREIVEEDRATSAPSGGPVQTKVERKSEIKARNHEQRYRFRLYEAIVEALKVNFPRIDLTSPVTDLLLKLAESMQPPPTGGLKFLPPTKYEVARETLGSGHLGERMHELPDDKRLLVAFTVAARYECAYHDNHKPEARVLTAFADFFDHLDKDHIRREAEVELMSKKERREAGL